MPLGMLSGYLSPIDGIGAAELGLDALEQKLHKQGIEEISIFSNSSHLEWRAGLSDTILKGTHPGTIPARATWQGIV
jgi:hypothetical protein